MYLTLQNSGHDLIHLRNGFSNGWIHHVTFGTTADEQLSIRNGADNITISWCKFNNSDKGSLLRAQSEDEIFETQFSHVTLHHNYWNSVRQRTPKVGNAGHFHIFNDFVFEWDYTGVKAIKNGQVYLESGIFQPKSGAPTSKQLQAATPFENNVSNGLMKLADNLFMGGSFGYENKPESVFVPPYSYVKDPASQSTRDSIIAGAGWQDVPFPDATAQQSQPEPPGDFAAQ
jgi:pectate lyase